MMQTVLSSVLYVLKAALLIAGIAVMTFFLIRVVPGDVVNVMAIEGSLTEEQAEGLRAELGLAQSTIYQFRDWVTGAKNGDLGVSLRFRVPVSDMLLRAIPTTLVLAGGSILFGFILAGCVAVAAVVRPNSIWVRIVDILNIWSIAVPTFCAGLMAILIFSIWLGWLPVLGNLLVPMIVLGMDAAGQIVKPLHEDMKELKTASYIRTARSKGLSRFEIAAYHMLPAAAPVLLSVTNVVAASFVAGTLTMEVLYGLPGLGSLAFNAISGRDYPLIQAVILLLAISVVLINTASDFAQRLIDPRPRG